MTAPRWYQTLPDAPARHRLLLAGVRHRRRAAAVLRRPRHPRRRPPQGRQRPRRADHRRRPALPPRLLHPVALARGLAAGALPQPRPRRPAADPAARSRTATPARIRVSLPEQPARCTPRSGSPRSAGCRCCCSTPTWPRTTPLARDVTDRLYGGGTDHRLLQELLLGVGGVRAVRAYCRDHRPPRARGVPHQRGPRRLPRPGAHPRAHRGPAHLRRGARGGAAPAPSSPPTPRCRPASTGSRASMIARQFGGDNAWPTVPVDRILALGAERTARAATRRCSTWP